MLSFAAYSLTASSMTEVMGIANFMAIALSSLCTSSLNRNEVGDFIG